MRIKEGIKLDFCDVLIRPKRSDAASRKGVNLLRTFKMPHSDSILKDVFPVCAANMDTTGTFNMAMGLNPFSALCALHKFYSIDALVQFFGYTDSEHSFYTMGLRDEELDKLAELVQRLPGILPLLCVDVANGYTKYFVDRIKCIRDLYPNAIIMAGNVATPEMVQELILEGADIVKVGIGPGSHCTTRLMTGVGYPQLSAIIECADAAHGLDGYICADGGCSSPSDIAKAFGAGADFVMLGGMLAGTDECEGVRREDGLEVHGMSSRAAQELHYGEVRDYAAPEGRESLVKLKGPVKVPMLMIRGALRSTCAYVGASSLRHLSKCTTFIRVNRTQ